MKALFFAILLVVGTASARAQFNLDKIVEGAGKVVKGASGIGIEEEISIGGSVAVEIAAANGGIWKDEEATRRVNLIGKTLGRYSDRPSLTYRFGILNSESINGFSAPGGYIFITKGAYQAAENDDQLAGILAHEINHVTRRHALRIISRSEMLLGLSEVVAGSGKDYTQYDTGVNKISDTLLKTGYDAGSEFDADRMGRELAGNTGYNRDGLLQFLQKLEAMKTPQGGAFSSHPALVERIKKLGGTSANPVVTAPAVPSPGSQGSP